MMDPKTGELYPSMEEARLAILKKPGITEEEASLQINNLVELSGREKSIKSVSASVKADRRKRKNKEARNSRRKNRK